MSEDKTQQLLYQAQMLETYFSDLTNKEHTLFNVLTIIQQKYLTAVSEQNKVKNK